MLLFSLDSQLRSKMTAAWLKVKPFYQKITILSDPPKYSLAALLWYESLSSCTTIKGTRTEKYRHWKHDKACGKDCHEDDNMRIWWYIVNQDNMVCLKTLQPHYTVNLDFKAGGWLHILDTTCSFRFPRPFRPKCMYLQKCFPGYVTFRFTKDILTE